MDPYRTAPHTRSPRGATPAGGIVVLVVGAWVVLGTGAPIGKDAALWAFTAALVMAIALVWRRARHDGAASGPKPQHAARAMDKGD